MSSRTYWPKFFLPTKKKKSKNSTNLNRRSLLESNHRISYFYRLNNCQYIYFLLIYLNSIFAVLAELFELSWFILLNIPSQHWRQINIPTIFQTPGSIRGTKYPFHRVSEACGDEWYCLEKQSRLLFSFSKKRVGCIFKQYNLNKCLKTVFCGDEIGSCARCQLSALTVCHSHFYFLTSVQR